MYTHTLEIHGQSYGSSQIDVSAREFSFRIDQPESLGGQNQAPHPLEYLLGGLAGCINSLAYRVADELNLRLYSLKICVNAYLNPDKSLGKFTLDRAGFKNISVKLQADTDANDALLNTWLNIIETRSPARDVLGKGSPVAVTLKRTSKEKYCV